MRLAALAAVLACCAACGPASSTDTAPASPSAPTTTSVESNPIDPVSGVTSQPVVPASERESFVFESLPVVGSFRDAPRGLVFVFHGSGGSEKIVDQIETTDILNQLEAAGFTWAATASVDRDGGRAWNLVSDDPAVNPDLGRLLRLHRTLIDSGRIAADLPVHGLGMSNGARFTGLWADAMRREGLPVRSAVMVMGTVDPHINRVVVPTLFVTGVNDDRVSPARIAAQYESARESGSDVRLITLGQRPVSQSRFTRIPGIDVAASRRIFSALSSARFIDGTGQLLGQPTQVGRIVRRLAVELTAAQRREVINQISADLAMHQFNAVAAPDIVDWLTMH